MPVSVLVFKVGVLDVRLHQFGKLFLFIFFSQFFEQLCILVAVVGFQFSFYCVCYSQCMPVRLPEVSGWSPGSQWVAYAIFFKVLFYSQWVAYTILLVLHFCQMVVSL